MINKIKEWGVWSRHAGYERYSTPLFALMRQNGCFHTGNHFEPNISDEDALAVDKAMIKLKSEYAVLFDVLFAYYVWGWTYREISIKYMTPLEYPHQKHMASTDSRKKMVSTATIGRMIEEGERLVYLYIEKQAKKT